MVLGRRCWDSSETGCSGGGRVFVVVVVDGCGCERCTSSFRKDAECRYFLFNCNTLFLPYSNNVS